MNSSAKEQFNMRVTPTNAQMRVDAGVSGCPREILVFPVGNVLMRTGITILLGQAKVNDVDQVPFLPQAHEKVVRFDITMDEVLGMDILNSTDLQRRWKDTMLLMPTKLQVEQEEGRSVTRYVCVCACVCLCVRARMCVCNNGWLLTSWSANRRNSFERELP